MSSLYTSPDSGVAALIRARQSVEAAPDSVSAHFDHALALCQLEQWEPAIHAWRNVVRLDPANAFAYINMGVVHLEQAQWTQAENAFEQAVRCEPEQASAYYGLGAARAQQGRLGGSEGARAAWEHALNLAPDYAPAREALADLNALEQSEPLPPVECVVTSRVHIQPPPPVPLEGITGQPLSEHALSGRNATPALPKETPATPARQRIKLPPPTGPSLASIADTVIAAQCNAQPALMPQAATRTEAAQDSIAPTLRLNAADVKAGHRRLRSQTKTRPQLFLSSLPGRVLLGAGTVSLLLAMVLAAQKARHQPEMPAENAALTRAMPTVVPSAPALNTIVSPPSHAPAPSVASSAPPSDTANTATARQATTSRRTTAVRSDDEPNDAPIPKPQSRVSRIRHAQHTDMDTPEPSHSAPARGEHSHTTRSVAANTNDTPRFRQSVARVQPKSSSSRSRSRGGEEDTFSQSALPPRSTSVEEWTDRPPQ